MKFLLVGSGARENAIAWKLRSSKINSKLYAWPSNPAINLFAEPFDLDNKASYEDLVLAAKKIGIDFVFVGPEAPLSEGLSDILNKNGIACFGPCKDAAQLESSKAFSKQLMKEAGVPTADFDLVYTSEQCKEVALRYLAKDGGVVLKASGLASGKGVFVCKTESDIDAALVHLYQSSMSSAASTVVIEELLVGRESSHFSFIGDNEFKFSLGFAVDFKRLKDFDKGPNTGGMGCYTPVPWLPANAEQEVMDKILNPLFKRMEERNIKYTGCLYTGLMWGKDGPKVVEFNVRLGDPETQVLAMRDQRDWGVMAALCVSDKYVPSDITLPSKQISNDGDYVVGVVIASDGYPFSEATAENFIRLPQDIFTREVGVHVFAAAIKKDLDGYIKSSKGRVLTIVGKGASFNDAREEAYCAVDEITSQWPKAQWRSDIAKTLDK